MDPLIRRLLDAPDPAPETPEEAAARRADLAARIDADIAEANAAAGICPRCGSAGPAGVCVACDHDFSFQLRPPREARGTIDVPQAMLDAFGLVEMNQ